MASPPTGTVTFLFTDIEGSTRLWESNTQAMQEALARHDELLRTTIEARDGYVFKTVGDAFCAAFGTATDAAEAALARPLYERSMAAARALLGEAEWEKAFEEGMAMSAEEAAEYALGEDDHA